MGISVVDTVAFTLRFQGDAIWRNGPDVLRPAPTFLNTNESTPQPLFEQRSRSIARKYAHAIAERLTLARKTRRSETEVARRALVFRVPTIASLIGHPLKDGPLLRCRRWPQSALRIEASSRFHAPTY